MATSAYFQTHRPTACIWLMCLFLSAGCVKVGPDFVRPTADIQNSWLEADSTRIRTTPADYRMWWRTFQDPVLDHLIQTAYAQNLPLRVAGARVFEARARLGIAIGEQYPQVQQAVGAASYNRDSERSPAAPQNSKGTDFDYMLAQAGGRVSWEIDFWGRFRRAVESEDANFLGSIAAYDNALVSLTADVARDYVLIRTLEERLRIARDNVVIQKESLKIAEARFQGGATSERDVQQALTQLRGTEATIPQIESGLRQAKNALCTLLGVPPRHLESML
ncbi:MAG: TolC family protein, partial [Hyphomicrobiales bacterium]